MDRADLTRRLTLVVALLIAPAGQALDLNCDRAASYPCGFEIRDLDVQKVPAIFKFQARVSDVKLPSGEGEFPEIRARVSRPRACQQASDCATGCACQAGTCRDGGGALCADVLCTEIIPKVKVRGGVLNVDIGRNMSCELEEVIAENADLAFQICLGAVTCLDPVALSATPYAVKASFATEAKEARSANRAAQAHWAHRLTADPQLGLRPIDPTGLGLGTGYLDFNTPFAARAQALYPSANDFQPHAQGGFIQWTPSRLRGLPATDPRGRMLTVAAQDYASKGLRPLDELVVTADRTRLTGRLRVAPAVPGAGQLVIDLGGFNVVDASIIRNRLQVGEAVSVTSGGLKVTGDSSITGDLTVFGDASVKGLYTAKQSVQVNAGGLRVDEKAVLAAGLQVTGDVRVTGSSDYQLPVRLAGGQARMVHGQLTPLAFDIVTGPGGARVLRVAQAGGALKRVVVKSPVLVEGLAEFKASTTLAQSIQQSGNQCPAGQGKDLNGNCLDIDECTTGTASCASNATCIDTKGSFECRCPIGTVGDGKTCHVGRLAFVTDQTFDSPSLNGVYGGDAICQKAAKAAGLRGDFAAFLGRGYENAASRLPDTPFYRVGDFQKIADSRTDLLDGAIHNPINRNEKGVQVSGNVWTGVAPSGEERFDSASGSCVGWGKGTPSAPTPPTWGGHGDCSRKDGGWAYASQQPCSTPSRIYCFGK